MNILSLWADFIFLVTKFPSIIFLSKEKKIAELLIKNNLKLSVAESCTGGLISSRLTDISGSSSYTYQNYVTYSNEAKEKILGVSHKSILNNGVVSYDVSLEMVKGLLNKTNCDIAISTTGIAGPLGGTKEKPTGLVYISVGNKKTQKTFKFIEKKYLNRRLMKYSFSSKALDILLKFLKENY